MSRFDLSAMAAVLQQGRHLRALSVGTMAMAGAWLVLATLFAPLPLNAVMAGALGLSLLAGLTQTYYAARVDLDARLLRGLARHADLEESADVLDASLQTLGLIGPEDGRRGWPERWRGMLGLLRRQGACLGLQGFFFVAAWIGAAWVPS